MREVLNTLLYLNRSGCQWDMLPHDLLPKSTLYSYFVQWRDDGTWHTVITALRERTRVAAPLQLRQVTPQDFPRLITIFADQKDHKHALDTWMAEHRPGWHIA